MSSVTCEKLRELWLDHQNNLQKARSKFNRLKIDKRKIPNRIQELEQELAGIEVQQLLSGSADRFNRSGRAAGLATVIEGEVRKARVQDELRILNARLRELDREISVAEGKVWEFERNGDTTKNEMERLGCDLR